MAKLKFERKGAFSETLESKQAKAQEAMVEISEKLSTGDISEINISQIISPLKHDRVGYSELAIKEFAHSLKEVGQLQPIVIRVLPDGKYERIIGFRRILAAKEAGWTKIKAIVLNDISEEVAALMMLSENLHREDPNMYDQTLKLIEWISLSIKLTEEDVIKLLYRFRNYDSNKINDLTDEEKSLRDMVNTILEKTAKISLTTMVDRLRILSLDKRLIQAMREKGLQYSIAFELNKIKEKESFGPLLSRTLQERPSKNELKEWIKEWDKTFSYNEPIKEISIQSKAKDILKILTAKKIKSLNKENLEEIQLLLEKIKNLL
jgi:ParB family chromosome partitioning protein